MKNILRTLLALCLATVMLPSCAFAEDSLFTPGIWEGYANGFGGEMKVSVETDANAILSVNVVSHKETAGVADPAIEKIPAAIVEHQSLAVDAISGCTMASDAILSAARQALALTCKDMSQLDKVIEKEAASTEVIMLSTDVIVVGAGGAGLAAATEAVEAGSSVILLEKMSAIGGNTIRAGSALNAADPERQQSIEMTDLERADIEALLAKEPHDEWEAKWQNTLKEEYAAYVASGSTSLFDSATLHKMQTYQGGDYVGNPAVIEVFADNALDCIHFLSKYGATWQNDVYAGMGALWKRSHNPELIFGSRGMTFIRPIEAFLKESGKCDTRVDYTAEHLIMENGRCVGVTGKTTAGQPFEVRASKGVVIAAGGFAGNVEMREAYNKHWAYLGDKLYTSNHPGATGDGIIMAQEIGANLVGMEWIQLTPWGSASIPVAAIDNQIFVNKEGKRFVNEDNRRDVMAAEALKQTDAQFYLIYDTHIVVNGVAELTGNKMDERVGQDLGGGEMIFKADTLEELAAQIGVPADAFVQTINDFNTYVDGSAVDPLGRALYDQKIDQGPFYASRTSPVVHHTMGGIEINEKAQVLDTNGAVIAGLYAAGEVTGGVHGSNRLGGNATTDIFVFGRIAGQNVAAE